MTSPFTNTVSANVEPVSTAGNDLNTNVYVTRTEATISAVTYTPNAAITGANTDTRKVSLVNAGTDGTGTDIIATLQFNSGVNAAAGDEKTVTLSGTAANLDVEAGEVLQWQSTHVGTGIADPGGLVSIRLAADYD